MSDRFCDTNFHFNKIANTDRRCCKGQTWRRNIFLSTRKVPMSLQTSAKRSLCTWVPTNINRTVVNDIYHTVSKTHCLNLVNNGHYNHGPRLFIMRTMAAPTVALRSSMRRWSTALDFIPLSLLKSGSCNITLDDLDRNFLFKLYFV